MSRYQYATPAPAAESNSLGVAGFVCSLIGLLFTGGLLCPIGLVLSLIALGRAPRGFAVAGVIVGLLGTCGIGLLVIFAGAALLAALGLAVVAVALTENEKLEITSDMVNMAIAIKAYESENRYLPASLDELDVSTTALRDPWGNRYEYWLQEEPPGFEIISRGADGQSGTPDDVALSALGEAWEAGGMGIQVEEQDDGGRVTITLGGRSIVAEGDDEGGSVRIDLGDRVLEIVGDDEGGRIDVVPDEDDDGDEPAPADDEPASDTAP
ncbi:MAG: type II secretion system protein GspG [Planctomycetota bacterium]|jgi:hypothetical protein